MVVDIFHFSYFEVNNLNIAQKSSKKEISEITSKSNKKIDSLATEVKDLSDFKADKISEERELKNKLKKVNKNVRLWPKMKLAEKCRKKF